MNDFHSDLEFSHNNEDLPIWETVYRKAFSQMVGMHSVREDGQHQRAGIDRVIVLSSGKSICIDEKVRRIDYGDILLEYVSVDSTGAPGWAEKSLLCDYIAYAILPRMTCYMLPVEQMQQAWLDNKNRWLAEYGTKCAQNKGYQTLGCAVPINTLFAAIGNCLRVRWRQEDTCTK